MPFLRGLHGACENDVVENRLEESGGRYTIGIGRCWMNEASLGCATGPLVSVDLGSNW